ncbi:MAG: hypothetical protein KDC44_16820, partial [Phaeodactylibacter sp.]|nr:hypothetical protein [Phaeodactylibacter sp.]
MKPFIFLLAGLLASLPALAQSLQWARTVGSELSEEAEGVFVDDAQHVYLFSSFKSSLDADPGAGEILFEALGEFDLLLQKFDPDGNLVWARHIGSVDNEKAEGLTVDPAGNIWLTGIYRNSLDVDPGPGAFILEGAASWDFFLLKLDADGNFVWAGTFGGPSFDFARAVAADNEGNIFLAGSFQSSIDFDPGPDLVLIPSTGFSNVFVLKLDNDGNYEWVKTVQGPSSNNCRSLCVDPDGNVLVTGDFVSSSDFDPGPDELLLTSNGWEDIFLLKLTAAGDLAWAQNFGNSIGDSGTDVTTDAAGNVYLTGFFNASVDFAPGPETYYLTSEEEEDVFVCKYNPDGALLWARQLGGPAEDLGQSIAVGPDMHVYIGGTFAATLDVEPGPGVQLLEVAPDNGTDAFLVEFTADGSLAWSYALGSTATDEVVDLHSSSEGFLYVTGLF